MQVSVNSDYHQAQSPYMQHTFVRDFLDQYLGRPCQLVGSVGVRVLTPGLIKRGGGYSRVG